MQTATKTQGPSTGEKVAAIIEAFNSRYDEEGASAEALKVRYEPENGNEPWVVAIEDGGNPADYGQTHCFQATTFEEAVDSLYEELVLK